MGERHQFRANWHDYNGGIYFITICCKHMCHYFGYIEDGEMNLSSIGRVVKVQIESLPQHFKKLEIWNYVIMPNHIHMVMRLDSVVRTHFNASTEAKALGCLKPRMHDAPETQDFHHQSRLSLIMRCFKGGVTREARRLGLRFAWHSRFHEHIIRNQRAFEMIMNYIDKNVANWDKDCFHK